MKLPPPETETPLDRLMAELARTSVLSEQFKSFIVTTAQCIAAEAFERGRASGEAAFLAKHPKRRK